MIQLLSTIRIVQVAPSLHELCSATDEAYSTTFLLLLLNLLKTGSMLAMKLQKLQALPGLWKKKKKLFEAKLVRAESVGLAPRVVQCDSVRTGGADDADDSGESDDCRNDSESTGPSLLAAGGDSSWRKHAHKRASMRCMHTYTIKPLKTALKHIHALAAHSHANSWTREHDGTASHSDWDDSPLPWAAKCRVQGQHIASDLCCAGAPVPTISGSCADSHANAFEYHCQCGAPIVADSRHRDVCAELVMAALPESGR